MTSTETQTTAPAPAKKTPAKKTPAKKAAPKATTPAARKLRWTVAEGEERNQKGGKEQTAVADGHEYKIARSGEAWKLTMKVDGKTTTLVEGSFAACYKSAVEHNRAR
jgi:hypothetical protein